MHLRNEHIKMSKANKGLRVDLVCVVTPLRLSLLATPALTPNLWEMLDLHVSLRLHIDTMSC